MVSNSKKEIPLAAARLASAPSCVSDGVEVADKVELYTNSDEQGEERNDRATTLLQGLHEFFEEQENCDEQFIFAYHNETVAGIYTGSQLGKGTVNPRSKLYFTCLSSIGFQSRTTLRRTTFRRPMERRVWMIGLSNG